MDDAERDEASIPYRSLLDREAAPGLARLAAGAWWRTNVWTAQTAVKATRRIARAARSGESAGALLDDVRREMADGGRRMLGIGDDAKPEPHGGPDTADYDDEALRERWDDLMDLSTEIEVEVDGHPAFAGIVSQLHPDEARILRLLTTEGPQAAVDVRNWRPLGIGSHLVAQGLNMIGQHAGCLLVDRVPVYLSNLNRLGLIWFAHDPIGEIGPYQVLEAQPEVKEALKRAGRGTTVRRSVRLTPFGEQFCAACLPQGTAEFEAVVAPRGIEEARAAAAADPDPGIG